MIHIKDMTCYRDKKKKKKKKNHFKMFFLHFRINTYYLLNQKTVFCLKLLYDIMYKNLKKYIQFLLLISLIFNK
jgi:hypothetical protein